MSIPSLEERVALVATYEREIADRRNAYEVQKAHAEMVQAAAAALCQFSVHMIAFHTLSMAYAALNPRL